MATAKELLMQELKRRQAQEQSDQNAIRGDIQSQRAMAEIDPIYRRNLGPSAQLMDDFYGGNMAKQEASSRPESTEIALRRAFQAQAATPKQNLLGYLQGQLGQDNADRKLAADMMKKQQGRQLSANDVMKIQEGENIPMMLEDVDKVIESNAGIFGPFEGRARQLNPYDTQGKTVEAQMRAASQAFGRYMEGGVLRKEDEEKYRRMFPNLSDTTGVAKNKLEVVKRLMQQRQAGNLQALSGAGFDTSIFAGGGQGAPIVQESGIGQDGSVDLTKMSDAELRKMAGM